MCERACVLIHLMGKYLHSQKRAFIEIIFLDYGYKSDKFNHIICNEITTK